MLVFEVKMDNTYAKMDNGPKIVRNNYGLLSGWHCTYTYAYTVPELHIAKLFPVVGYAPGATLH